MVKFLLVLLLISSSIYSQSIEQRVEELEKRVQKIEDTLGFNPQPIDTTLVKPTYEGIILQSFNSDVIPIPYSQMYLNNGYYNLYIQKGSSTYRVESVNGLNSWNYVPVSAPRGTIYFHQNRYYASYHRWYAGEPYSYFAISLDGTSFSDVATLRYSTGEDRTILYNNPTSEFYLYTRIAPFRERKLGFQKSSDFRNWTAPIEILTTNGSDGALKRFYSMSVVRTSQGYFGLLNVYRVGNSGQDVEQVPPYGPDEHTLDLQLVWSEDGITGWQRLNNQQPLIERKAGVKQLLGIGSIIGSDLIITTIESKRRHTLYDDNIVSETGNYYYTARYKLSLENLYKYKR